MLKKIYGVISAVALLLAGTALTTAPGYAAGNIIYLASSNSSDSNNGNTETTPVATLAKATELANPGDTIKIIDSYTHQSGENLVFTKNVTIEGGAFNVRLNSGAKLIFNADITLKNLTLTSTPENASQNPFRLFLNGHRLVFDNVNAPTGGTNTLPTIYLGTPKNASNTGQQSAFETINTSSVGALNIEAIHAGNEGDTALTSATGNLAGNINLDAKAKVNTVHLGETSGNVDFTTASPNVKTIDANGSPNSSVTIALTNGTEMANTLFTNVEQLTVSADSVVAPKIGSTFSNTTPITVNGHLKLTSLVNSLADDPITSVNVGAISGNGKVDIPAGEFTLNVNGEVNNVTVTIDNNVEPLRNGHQYVNATGGNYTLTAKQDANRWTFTNGTATFGNNSQPTQTVTLTINDYADEESPLVIKDNVPYTEPFDAVSYFKHVHTEFVNTSNNYYVLHAEGAHAPVVDNTQYTITWTAQEVGHYTVRENGVDKPYAYYTVNTDQNGSQTISYTLPQLPENKKYRYNNEDVTDLTVNVPVAEAFSNRIIEVVEKTATPVKLIVKNGGESFSPELFNITVDRKEGALTAEAYKSELVAKLQEENHRNHILLNAEVDDKGAYAPENSTITWNTQEAGFLELHEGKYTRGAGTRTQYTVTTADDGAQTVSYTLPELNEGEKYKVRQANGQEVDYSGATGKKDVPLSRSAQDVVYIRILPEQPKVKLIVLDAGNNDAELFTVEDQDYQANAQPADYKGALAVELKKLANYVLIDEGTSGETNGMRTITWKAQKVGSYTVKKYGVDETQPLEYTVETTYEGEQTVSLTLPALEENQKYELYDQPREVVQPGKVTLTGADRVQPRRYLVKPVVDPTVKLVAEKASGQPAVFEVGNLPYPENERPLEVNAYLTKLVEKLRENPTLVLASEAVITDAGFYGRESTIKWTVREVGTFQTPGGQPTHYLVETLDDTTQTVSYTLPPAPEGKRYLLNGQPVENPTDKVTLTAADRFTNLVFTLEDVPADNNGNNTDSDDTGGSNNSDTPAPGEGNTPGNGDNNNPDGNVNPAPGEPENGGANPTPQPGQPENQPGKPNNQPNVPNTSSGNLADNGDNTTADTTVVQPQFTPNETKGTENTVRELPKTGTQITVLGTAILMLLLGVSAVTARHRGNK